MAKKCRQGKPCGNTCIAKNRKCRSTASGGLKGLLNGLVNTLNTDVGSLLPGGGSSKPETSVPDKIQQAVEKLIEFEPENEVEYKGKTDSFDFMGREVEFIGKGDVAADILLEDIEFGQELGGMREKEINEEELDRFLKESNGISVRFDITVDGSFNNKATKDLTKGEQLKLIRELKNSWAKTVEDLPEGTMVKNLPSSDSRAKLYKRFGFSGQKNNGEQYGIKRNGKIEPLHVFNYVNGNGEIDND